MSTIHRTLRRTSLPILLVLCLAALSVSYAFADDAQRPLATQVIGDPDAAVTGKLAVGTAMPGNKALTVVGVIDFLGAGTVHNYFTQGGGNNMQINANVDEANTVGDATKSQWKLVLGSSLDWFSIRRSPAGAMYNEDALFFIEGATGNVGIATVDTGNGGAIPLTPEARLHVETASGDAIWGRATSTTQGAVGVFGYSNSVGVAGETDSTSGRGVVGNAFATGGSTYGVHGGTWSPDGIGVSGRAHATSGGTRGVYGQSDSSSGYGVYGWAPATIGVTYGVYGQIDSSSLNASAVYGHATSTNGLNFGVYGRNDSTDGYGVVGSARSYGGAGIGVHGGTNATNGHGVQGVSWALSGVNYGVYGVTNSPSGYGVYYVGGLAGTGVKSAIVETDDFGWRHLYAVESPQNWFEDFGQATLTAGEVVVPIEEVFAQTVNLDAGYHVFLTPLGQCALYIAEKSSSSFTVRAVEPGECDIAFDYRIIAPRLDYEDLRLKEAEDPEAVAAAIPEAPSAPSAQ